MMSDDKNTVRIMLFVERTYELGLLEVTCKRSCSRLQHFSAE